MLKQLVLVVALIGLVCIVSAKSTEENDSTSRMLFVGHEQSSTYSHAKKYKKHKPYFTVELNGNYKVQLQASSSSEFSWVPAKGCTKNCWHPKHKKEEVFSCEGKTCKITQKSSNSFKSQFLSQAGMVICKKYANAKTTFTMRETTVKNVGLRLCEQFQAKTRKGLQQHGVLGLAYSTSKNNLLHQMKVQKFIKKEEWSYYISDSKTFISFGNYDNFLQKLGHSTFTFIPGVGTQGNAWALNVKSLSFKNKQKKKVNLLTNAKFQFANAGSKVQFDTSAYGYFISSKKYFDNFVALLNSKGAKCEQFPAEDKLDKFNADQSTFTKKKFPHIVCKNAKLKDLPTIKIAFQNQVSGKAKFFKLKPKYYAVQKGGNVKVLVYRKQAQNQGTADAPATPDQQTIYFGRKFMKHYYMAFDQQNKQIKIAKSWQAPKSIFLPTSIILTVIIIGIIAIAAALITQQIVVTKLPTWQTVTSSQYGHGHPHAQKGKQVGQAQGGFAQAQGGFAQAQGGFASQGGFAQVQGGYAQAQGGVQYQPQYNVTYSQPQVVQQIPTQQVQYQVPVQGQVIYQSQPQYVSPVLISSQVQQPYYVNNQVIQQQKQ